MNAEYTDVINLDGEEIRGSHKAVQLPFKRLSARALVVRRRDGAILGTLHRAGGRYALPGGAPEDGESTLGAVLRELEEEQIQLIDPDSSYEGDLVVDYFEGYGELSVWHLFLVEDARIRESEENVETRWIAQEEDAWYPSIHEKLLMAISRHMPGLNTSSVTVGPSNTR